MLFGPSFSVLLDPLVTTSPNEMIVLTATAEYEEQGKKDRGMGSQKEAHPTELISTELKSMFQ